LIVKNCQYKAYLETTLKSQDTLDKASTAASNFVFPGLNKDRTELLGCYSTEGMSTILSQISTDGNKLRALINKNLFKGKLTKGEEENFIFTEFLNVTINFPSKKHSIFLTLEDDVNVYFKCIKCESILHSS
jgi:hypothetical protein